MRAAAPGRGLRLVASDAGGERSEVEDSDVTPADESGGDSVKEGTEEE